MSKWREWQLDSAIQALKNDLLKSGLWPFKFYDFKKIAARDRMNVVMDFGLNDMFKNIYSEHNIEPTGWSGPHWNFVYTPKTDIERYAYQSMRFRKPKRGTLNS